MSYNASYWFARGYYDGRSTGVEANDIPQDQIFSYQSGFQTGVQDYNELEDNYESAYDGQPDEAQEWHDFDPDC